MLLQCDLCAKYLV
uniref:Uncharacterized protein n=1 Tax=Arundo donax TaxID=35708 RepID=A0A0A9FLN6_ARUDO